MRQGKATRTYYTKDQDTHQGPLYTWIEGEDPLGYHKNKLLKTKDWFSDQSNDITIGD